MTQRAPSPFVHSFTMPVSTARVVRRDTMEPSPPAPGLLTMDNKASAGWEMMAAATPAITPEDRATVILVPSPAVLGEDSVKGQIFSAAAPYTANLAMAWHLLEQGRSESGVESLHDTIVSNDLGDAVRETGSVARVSDQADANSFERAQENISNGLSAAADAR